MTTTKQKIKEEKKLKGETIPLLKYESTHLLRGAIIPVIVAAVVSFFLSNLFGGIAFSTLSSNMMQIIQNLIFSFLGISLPFMAFSTSSSTLGSLFSAASGINTLVTMSVVPIVFTAMLFTSTIKEEDIYPLLRVDRNKLLLIRSFLNAAFYTVISVLIIYFTKQYIISSNTWGSMFSAFLNAITPIFALIPAIFIFLLFLQSLAVVISLYFRRVVYVIPSFLLIELLMVQLSTTLTASQSGATQILSVIIQYYPMIGNLNTLLPYITLYIIILVEFSNPSIIYSFLLLSQLGGLIHTFSPLFGGVWNLSVFDFRYLPYTIFLQMPDSLVFNSAYSALIPFAVTIIPITESCVRVAYQPWLNFLYVAVIPVILYSLTTILFGRKTL